MNQTVTSGTSIVALMLAWMRLLRASVRSSAMGRWAPVNTTGLGRPSSRYESAEAVYAMVSVPCSTTKPS